MIHTPGNDQTSIYREKLGKMQTIPTRSTTCSHHRPLEIGRCVDRTGVVVLIESALERSSARSGARRLFARIRTDRSAGIHQVVFVGIVVALASPHSPSHKGDTRQQRSTADANHDTDNGVPRGGAETGTSRILIVPIEARR